MMLQHRTYIGQIYNKKWWLKRKTKQCRGKIDGGDNLVNTQRARKKHLDSPPSQLHPHTPPPYVHTPWQPNHSPTRAQEHHAPPPHPPTQTHSGRQEIWWTWMLHKVAGVDGWLAKV